jgi:cytochrome b
LFLRGAVHVALFDAAPQVPHATRPGSTAMTPSTTSPPITTTTSTRRVELREASAPARTLVWDLPTRLFHFFLILGFGSAAVITLMLGTESAAFPYHAIIGMVIALLVVLRIVWGFFGTTYARFRSFSFGPTSIAQYMSSLTKRGGPSYTGHNPGLSLGIFAMLALLLGIAGTGIMRARGNEGWATTHTVLVYAMLGLITLHILGVILHVTKRKENIVGSMIHGRKAVPLAEGIVSPKPLVAVVGVAIAAAWTIALVRNYDNTTKILRMPLIGTELRLGDAPETPAVRDSRTGPVSE